MDHGEDAAELADELSGRLRALADPDAAAGMARFGISPVGTLGVSMTRIRGIAAELRALRRGDPRLAHEVAARLWASGIHEARLLAGLLDVPALVTREQADSWVADLDSWDTCDQLQHLIAATPFAYRAIPDWIARDEEFVRRAGLVLLCTLAIHDKAAADERFTGLLPLVEAVAGDARLPVSKAVSWALRQVGKRSATCHSAAMAATERILAAHPARAAGPAGTTSGDARATAGGETSRVTRLAPADRAARWAATDALRELRSEAVRARLGLV